MANVKNGGLGRFINRDRTVRDSPTSCVFIIRLADGSGTYPLVCISFSVSATQTTSLPRSLLQWDLVPVFASQGLHPLGIGHLHDCRHLLISLDWHGRKLRTLRLKATQTPIRLSDRKFFLRRARLLVHHRGDLLLGLKTMRDIL